MSLTATPEQIEDIVGAVWQVLDDMRETGLSCCRAAKAEIRIAFEPFRVQMESEAPGVCDNFMPLEAAQSIINGCR